MKSILFYFNGRPVQAQPGQTVATALWAAGIRSLRISPRRHEPRGMFCGMGVCQECVVLVEGCRREACMTAVRPDLSVAGITDAS